MNKIYSIFFLALCFSLIQCKEDQTPKPQTTGTGIQAIDILSQEIEKTPMDPTLYYERANAYVDNDGYEYAIKDLEKAIQLDSLNPNYYHALSDVYMDNLQSKLSLLIMMKVGGMYPQRTATQLKLAETQLILKQYQYATSTINKILSYDPQNAEAYFMLGLIFYEQGETQKATNALLTAAENDSELIDAWLMLGEIGSKSDDPKTKNYYENALIVQPNNIAALHSLAFYLQNHNDVEGAQNLYRKIHVLDKNYVEANLNSGILYIEQDSLDKAYEQFNIMVQNKPEYYLGHYYRGVANELKGNLDAALIDYRNSANINPQYEKAVAAVAAMEKALKK